MSRLVAVEFLSLDGVIQAPGYAGEDTSGGFEHGGWTGPFMSEHRRYMTEVLTSAGALLLGRRTYDIFASYWPSVVAEEDQIARVFNSVPKYLASTTLDRGEWRETTIIPGDLAARVTQLKSEIAGDIVVIGSSKLAQSLHADRLVDAYQLWLHPVVLGSGKRLFEDGPGPTAFELVASRSTRGGLVILDYAAAA